ncbi:MAG: preprotein translocase subunit SecA [Pseudomonadota bacterium]
MAVFTKLFGSRNDRLIKQYRKAVKRINQLEESVQALDDAALGAKTDEFRQRFKDGETLEQLLPEAFAAVREASRRTLGLRHYDVQLIGGMVLNDGNIAEMRTGEGKTLMATLAAYLNALSGDAVHIVTVNEYLAARDADWMRPIYEFLNLTVGVSKSGQGPDEKREAYGADITYATNNELGFDYLRDNLAFRLEDRAQRSLGFAIVDEVDSILIDEARTPLIISGPSQESTDLYVAINKLVPKLKQQMAEEADPEAGIESGDFWADEKAKQIHLTEEGLNKVEDLMVENELLDEGASLYDASNIRLMHHLTAALRAHTLYQKDVAYIVQNQQIVIVDEFTGRTMPGRRWSDGLHQAIEAKEKVPVKEENQTVASITFQNFFRMYDKLSGMTGTADTEAAEFQQIYGLEVVVIPTHKPMIREDNPDLVFLNQDDKFDAIIEDIEECRNRMQPVLVGTTSIETSELLSGVLNKKKIPHEVLNAKQHEREADIVADAGKPGAVTIATNMAGRGTDIVLGGNLEAELERIGGDDKTRSTAREDWQKRHDQVLEAGGLHIVGTERHESRRIDNQLRGRSGRQGDPGSSRFFLSMEDTLMRIFGDPNRTKALLQRFGMKEGEAIESPLLSRQIEKAQRKVESHNFDIRKHLLQYDDVANDQRRVVYSQRVELMEADDIAESVEAIREEVIDGTISEYIPPGSLEEQWDTAGLQRALAAEFTVELDVPGWVENEKELNEAGIRERVQKAVSDAYSAKVEEYGGDTMRQLEKALMLQQLDQRWKEHLAAMDYLRQGIGLRAFAQKKPEQEYKREAFELFGDMLEQVKRETISLLSRMRVRSEAEIAEIEQQRQRAEKLKFQHANASALSNPQAAAAGGGAVAGAAVGGGGRMPAPPSSRPAEAAPFKRAQPKVGRNQPCPCGSGKKYKQCCGKLS